MPLPAHLPFGSVVERGAAEPFGLSADRVRPSPTV